MEHLDQIAPTQEEIAMINNNTRIFVAGHKGLVGTAILRRLQEAGCIQLLTLSRAEVDYRDSAALGVFFQREKPEVIFLAAGKTGGIKANTTVPADFLYDNLSIQTNFFHLAAKHAADTLIFFGSSCVYPKGGVEAIKEEHLLTGPIEQTSQSYAAAKIAGILGCQAYNRQYPRTKMICLIPNSIFGPNDNFSTENSHVLPALIRKIHDAKTSNAKSVKLWGSGMPRREFIFSSDVADAAIFAVQNKVRFQNTHYNVGSGTDISIKDLAALIAAEIEYGGKIEFDCCMPDGTSRKLLDSSKFSSLGWKPNMELVEGIRKTYDWFLKRQTS